MAIPSQIAAEKPPSSNESSSTSSPDDPENDESYLQSHTRSETVYLATINLAFSDAVSGTTGGQAGTTFFRRLLAWNHTRFSKHWAIVIRDTLYELSRENSLVALKTTHWPSVQDQHDPPVPIGTTTLTDAEILSIAKTRFSRWPKHGYSLTYSNCQCFCYRFSWYICDETRHLTSVELSSKHLPHLPIRAALLQSYAISAAVVIMAIGWAVWMRNLWWPVRWDTIVGILYESGLFFMLRTLYTGREHLGGWRDSEVIALKPTHQSGVFDAIGLCLARDFAYGPPYFRNFVEEVWKLFSSQVTLSG